MKYILLLFAIFFWSPSQPESMAQEPDLYTNKYPIPRGFWKLAPPRGSARGIFEDAGIPFPPGATVISGGPASFLIVKNTKENMLLVEAFLDDLNEQNAELQMHIFVEFIEVDSSLYHDWMFENKITGNGDPLRRQAQEWVKSGKATIIETLTVTARSGNRSRARSVSQKMFPTEPGVPEIPNVVSLEGKATKAPRARAVSSAFAVLPSIVGGDSRRSQKTGCKRVKPNYSWRA